MGKDTIYRQDAMDMVKDVCDAIMSGCESWYDPETEDEVYKDILEVDAILKCNKEIRIALRNMPSAQPEREKGEWIANGDIHKECPFCGEDWNKYVFGDVWYTGELPKFCPNCGADMR